MNINMPFVSVVIPVLNDSGRLKTCLEALANQTYPKGSYEVIVVDNGSDEDIKGLVSRFDGAITAYEPAPGPAAARNKGMSIAKGDVLAFTDADCIPCSGWIEKGVESISSVPGCGMVGGRIDFIFKDPAKPTTCELYDSMMYLQQKRYIANRKYAVTANLFTLRSVINDVGLFDNTGLPFSGEDNDLGWRVFAKGYKQVYSEEARVQHPARYRLNDICRKMARTTEGRVGLGKKWAASKRAREFSRIWHDNIGWSLNRTKAIFTEPRLKGRRMGVLFVALFLLIIRLLETIKFSLLKYKKV